MKAALQTLCDQFIANRQAIKAVFPWDNSALYPVCANIFCARGMEADEDRLRQCKAIVKEQSGFFSPFRNTPRLPVISLMAVQEDPDAYFAKAMRCYRALKEQFFSSSSLDLALAAALLADQPEEIWAEKAQRGRTLYRRMKKEHPFLTGSEDSIFAVLLSMSDRDDDTLIRSMEQCYQLLKTRFFSRNDVQSASHVLTLAPGDVEEHAQRTIELYDAILAAGGKYSRGYALSTLAATAVLPEDIATLTADLMDVDAFLSRQKSYGFWGFDKRTRMMHAALIVSDAYAPQLPTEAASITGTLAMIAAQQAAAAAAICAASASASAAANSAS